MAKTHKEPLISEGQYTVKEVHELNFFDLTGKKAKSKGTSNKMYHAELQVANSGDKAQLFTMYGATGAVQRKEWRHFDDEASAKKELEKILKSKRKKGYKNIDVAQRAIGSEEAKNITKTVELTNVETPQNIPKSNLHPETQRLISTWFKSTNNFVIETLDKGCPLGQLTNKQIEQGRNCLSEAKNIVNKNKLSKNDKDKILDLTNEFYGLIPHNLGSGSRGKMEHLLLDDLQKIVSKETDLDTLLDAKSVGAVLKDTSPIDEQYKTLNADIEFIDHDNPMFKFISKYFEESKIKQHGFHKAKVLNIWSLNRKDGEKENFLNSAEKISSECKKYNYVDIASRIYKADPFSVNNRPDLDSKSAKLFKKSNVWLCWHGTRSANLVGITKRGLLIRPAGAVLTGAMFGSGLYYSHNSSKSLNYCDGGCYASGSKNTKKYLFLTNTCLGNLYTAPGPKYYKSAPKGYHSVFGKGKYTKMSSWSTLMNDEMITYDTTQSTLSYMLEIS